jgi:hypothetical protein
MSDFSRYANLLVAFVVLETSRDGARVSTDSRLGERSG